MQLREQLIDKLNLNAFEYPAPGNHCDCNFAIANKMFQFLKM